MSDLHTYLQSEFRDLSANRLGHHADMAGAERFALASYLRQSGEFGPRVPVNPAHYLRALSTDAPARAPRSSGFAFPLRLSFRLPRFGLRIPQKI
ncbi:hypothetical protein [Algicella marina]|uniref:Uncharacterized protein n=1 Tax=Algicella marina TaxID=2683284 RepID=A0A6P1T5L3_9RHOB|nr:hypothetical protein [Algicella marina]QHQ36973.1 hypothetical protein GO499_18185 [Algicella marina]